MWHSPYSISVPTSAGLVQCGSGGRPQHNLGVACSLYHKTCQLLRFRYGWLQMAAYDCIWAHTDALGCCVKTKGGWYVPIICIAGLLYKPTNCVVCGWPPQILIDAWVWFQQLSILLSILRDIGICNAGRHSHNTWACNQLAVGNRQYAIGSRWYIYSRYSYK